MTYNKYKLEQLPVDPSSGAPREWLQHCSLNNHFSLLSHPNVQLRQSTWHVSIAVLESETLTVSDKMDYLLISCSSPVN